jgi:hypothetical protein
MLKDSHLNLVELKLIDLGKKLKNTYFQDCCLLAMLQLLVIPACSLEINLNALFFAHIITCSALAPNIFWDF